MKYTLTGRMMTAIASLAAALSIGSPALARAQTIPVFTHVYTADASLGGQSYRTTGVGYATKSPFSTTPGVTTVNVVPIILRVFASQAGGPKVVQNPNLQAPCDTQTTVARVLNSPLFNATSFSSNGVNVSNTGPQQLISAVQRANYWSKVQATAYGLNLTAGAPIYLDYTTNTAVVSYAQRACSNAQGTMAIIDKVAFDVWLQAKLIDMLNRKVISASSIPLVIMADTAIFYYEPSGIERCCSGGYHGSLTTTVGTTSSTIVYGVGSYESIAWSSSGGLSGQGARPDISHIASVLEELVNNPFGTNVTPGYLSHLDRVSKTGFLCQTAMESGQVGTMGGFKTVTLNNYTYHYADAAFDDYFYNSAPATGAGGKYSFLGAASANTANCAAH